MNRTLVVVSGLPASGKSTVGRVVAHVLGVPLLDKDDLLEELFPTDRTIDPSERRELSRRANELLEEQATAQESAVIVSHWRWPSVAPDSGTPTGWLTSVERVVEIYCECSPTTALDRFVSRQRHRSHGDDLKDANEVLVQFETLAALGPLGVGELIRVSTEEHDESALVEVLHPLLKNHGLL